MVLPKPVAVKVLCQLLLHARPGTQEELLLFDYRPEPFNQLLLNWFPLHLCICPQPAPQPS